MKNLFIKGLPDDLAKAIKVTAAQKDLKIRELVIAAILAYLAAGRGIVEDDTDRARRKRHAPLSAGKDNRECSGSAVLALQSRLLD